VFFYKGLGHIGERCGEKKDSKLGAATNNYLEVLVNDEKMVQIQLDKDKVCEDNYDLFLHIRVPMWWHIWTHLLKNNSISTNEEMGWRREVFIDFEKEVAVKLKILTDFTKGKVSLDPMEIVLTIPKEPKYLEGVVKLAQRCKNEKHMVAIIFIVASNLLVVCMISINKSKTLQVLVKNQ
jgi:hypothetical protein